MKIKIFISFLFVNGLFAQIEPSVTFDSSTGNYLIQYQGYSGEVYEVIFEPATKIEPQIEASAFFESDSGIFKYEYTVRNCVNSQQRLLSFAVNYFSPIYNIMKPNQQWAADSYYLRPVFDWSHTRVSSYGVATPYTGIAPDSSVSGFSFKSSGLPVVVISYSRGETPTLHFPEEPPGEIEMQLDPLERFPANTVQRKTLGPKDPPEPFVSMDFLDTLISYKHQAFDLGWIDNEGILNSLDKKLEHAKEQLEKEKIKQTVNQLNAFVNEVEAQNGKHLTSEAYALLKYNAKYLIEKLEE